MKKHITTIVAATLALSSAVLWAQAGSWGDAQSSGIRESSATSMFAPGRYAFDGDDGTAWRLVSGATEGWVEAYTASAQRYAGATIRAFIPAGVQLAASVFSNGSYLDVPGGTISGPLDGVQKLIFPGELPPTARVLLRLSGPAADQARVNTIELASSGAPAPFGKIIPKSYTTNFSEYINIKASRLWNGINNSDWYEPLLSFPSEPFQTDAANQPTSIFPPYFGDPPVSRGEITWQLDGSYEIRVLKAFFINPGRWVRFEFWSNGQWTSAQDVRDTAGSGWERLELLTPVVTDKIRISFPGGWGQARKIGQLEVWGEGWSDAPSRPLVISSASSDGYQHFTLDDVDRRNYRITAIVPGVQTTDLTGQWNGNAITLGPVVQVSGSTIYRTTLSAQTLISGQQFLKLLTAGNLTGVSLDVGEDRGLIDLGSPWNNGFFDQSNTLNANPPLTSKTWALGNTYQIERLRVYMKGLNAPRFTTQLNGVGQNVSWTNLGSGWWEADLHGQLADTLAFDSDVALSIDQIQVFGTHLIDSKPNVEIWWTQSTPTDPTTSDGQDGNSFVGWIGDPSVQASVNGYTARQSGNLFWMPLNQMGMTPGRSYLMEVLGDLGGHHGRDKKRLYWWRTPPATLTQGVSLATTTQNTLTLSGTDIIPGSLLFIGGVQVPVVSGTFSYAVPLEPGYQIVSVEIWNSQKQDLLMSWQKPVYRSVGQPAMTFDLPPGDLWTQSSTLTVTGRVGNGPGLGLSLGGSPLSLSQDAYQRTVALQAGTQTLSFVLTDSLGRQTTQNLVVHRDSTPPLISIVSPTNGQFLSVSTFNMVVSSTSDSQLWWSFNGDPWQLGLVNPEVQVFALADGSHLLSVRAQDRSGNLSSTAAVSFTVDTQPPAPFAISGNVQGWTSNNHPTITFSTTDATSGVDHYSYAVDGGAQTTVTSPYQLTLTDGEHQVTVTAYDRAGNTTTSSIIFQIDTAAPVAVQNLRGVPGDTTVDVKWTTADTDIVLYHVTRSPPWPDGEHGIATAGTKDAGLANGTVYSYTVWAEDRAHNIGPAVQTSESVTGVAVAPVSASATVPTVVEYEDVTVVIPPAALPSDNIAVLVKQIDSPTLRDASSYPIVSPIYSISALVVAEDGSVRETTHTEFPNEVLVIFDYDESQLPNGFPEANLGVYYWDTTWSKWFKTEKSAVDRELKKIVFTTNHFTDFSVQPTMISDLSPQQLKDIGHSPVKSESATGAVTVSPQGGTAMTEVTDFVLQGKNGFALPIKRIYDTGTATADSPSLSLSASLSFNSVEGLLAGIASQLVSQGVSTLSGAIISKIVSIVKQNGDYALATGVGWRLSFPYVFSSNTAVSVRLPNGGYYSINQMQSNNSFWSNPVSRTLDFEFHEGEDFHFKVTQVRADVTDVIAAELSTGVRQALTNGNKMSPNAILSLAASLIPGWLTVASELWTKDGTYYIFDGSGRVVQIQDKTGFNTLTFHYDGLLLHDITDDLGRQVLFEYSNTSGQSTFVKPVVTRIWTEGFQDHDNGAGPGPVGDTARTVTFSYNWNASTPSGTFFNFLPTLTSTTDPEGRLYQYTYNQLSIVTGGGAIKINFLALLIDLIPGGSLVSDMLGISALTLSGNLQINLPWVISQVVAPGIGTTEVSVASEDLSLFEFTPTDYFLGLFPTALQISYQILFRLATERVVVTNSTGISETTHYSYQWAEAERQYYVSQSTVNDGRTRVVHYFFPNTVTRNRFISWDDYLLAVAQGLFQQEGLTVKEMFSLESGSTITNVSTGQLMESVANSWDAAHHRIMSSTTTRGVSTSSATSYQYDAWGNQTYVLTDTFSNGREQKSEQWSWYLNSGSAVPSIWGVPHVDADETLTNANIRDLLKGTVIRGYRPAAAGGGYEEKVQEIAYNAFGLKKTEGLWLGDHWATTAWTYYTDPAQLSSGSPQTRTGPNPGQVTSWTYDYTSFPQNMYTVREDTQNVIDPSGAVTSITQETAFDWVSGWKLYEKDGRGYVTEYSYDKLRRPTDVVRPGDEAPLTVGAWTVSRVNAPREHYAYDDTALTVTVSKGTYPAGTLKVYELDSYDNLGQLIRIDKYNTLGPSGATLVSLPQLQTVTTLAAYNAWGDVVSMTDPNGNTTNYAYDARGRVTRLTHPDTTVIQTAYDDTQNLKTTTNERSVITREWLNWQDQTLVKAEDYGITTRTDYNGLNQVVAQTDALLQTTVTYYSPFGKPSRVVHPNLDIWESPAQAFSSLPSAFVVTSVTPEDVLTYDDAGQLVRQKTGREGNWRESIQVFDSAGRIIKKTAGVPGVDAREEWSWYDTNGNLVKHADGLLVSRITAGQANANGTVGFSLKTYSSRNKVLTETDPLGAVVRYQYDFLDRKIQMKDPRANPDGNDNFTVNYFYNELDRLVLVDLPAVAGQGRGVVTITYDLRGNVVSQVDTIGKTTTWTYDKRNRKVIQSVVGADGSGPLLTAWGYDAVGNNTVETVASSINTVDPSQSPGLTTRKVYDGLNRLVETDLADGQKQINTLDALGRVTVVTDAKNNATRNTYNSLNKVARVVDASQGITNTYYSVWGDPTATQMQNTINGDQIWVRYFNAFSQVLYEQNNGRQLWRYSYDPRGLMATSVDPNDTTAVSTYTLTGLLSLRTFTNGSQVQSQSWTYDLAGSLMGATDGSVSTAINQAGGTYAPDPYDLINSYLTQVSSKNLSVAYTYDNARKPLSVTYPDGSRVSYQYNGIEQLTGIPGYASGGQYNFMGRLTSLTAANGTRRTKTWNPSTGTLDGYNWNVSGETPRSLGWDNLGNLVSKGWASGQYSSSYVYDQLSRLTFAQEGGHFETLTDSSMPRGSQRRDVAGVKALSFGSPSSEVKLDYYSSSIGVNLTSPQNISKVRLIGVSQRIQPRTVELYVSQDGSDGSWTILTDTTWLQDQTGVTLQFDRPHLAQFVKLHVTWDERDADNQPLGRHTLAGTVGQLLQVWYEVNGQSTSWIYDALGNRMEQDQVRASSRQTTYSYYINTSRVKQAGDWQFNYDANGNLIARGRSGNWNPSNNRFDWSAAEGEIYLYGYDLKNRLDSVQHGLAGSASVVAVASYTYDTRDLRVAATKEGATTWTQYDQSGDLLWHQDATQTRKYIQALGQTWAEVRTSGSTSNIYFHHTDHLGTTDVVTNASGDIVWSGDFEAFGSLTRSNGTIAFDASYTGKEFDADTGLYYYNARWYDPQLGRFITEDPARADNNWYTYTRNNPLKYIDLTGLLPVDAAAEGARKLNAANLIKAETESRNNPSYQPNAGGPGLTHCNEATFDVAEETGVDPSTYLGDRPRGETTANMASAQLHAGTSSPADVPAQGRRVELSPRQASNMAGEGWTVFGAYGNPDGHGHVVAVHPSQGDFDPAQGPVVSNVGESVGVTTARGAFGSRVYDTGQVRFYYDPQQALPSATQDPNRLHP